MSGIRIPVSYWQTTACEYINTGSNKGRPCNQRTYRAHFRLSPEGCSDLYYYLTVYGRQDVAEDGSYLPLNVQESHLLWVLHYLNTYASEEVCAHFCQVSVKTWRKHVWNAIKVLCNGAQEMVSSLSHFVHIITTISYLSLFICTVPPRSQVW